jgi:hypothetical protein
MTSMPPVLPHRRPGSEVGHQPEPVLGSCPACGARVRPGQPWCSLCHHRLGTPAPIIAADPELAPGPTDAARAEAAPVDPASAEQAAPAPAATEPPVEPAAAEPATGEVAAEATLPVAAMLVELAAVERHSPVPPALAELVGSGMLGKTILGGTALVGMLVVLVGLLSLVGLFV